MDRSTAAEPVVESNPSEDGARAGATTISMEEAVGYTTLACSHENAVGDTLGLKHDHVFLLVDRIAFDDQLSGFKRTLLGRGLRDSLLARLEFLRTLADAPH